MLIAVLVILGYFVANGKKYHKNSPAALPANLDFYYMENEIIFHVVLHLVGVLKS